MLVRHLGIAPDRACGHRGAVHLPGIEAAARRIKPARFVPACAPLSGTAWVAVSGGAVAGIVTHSAKNRRQLVDSTNLVSIDNNICPSFSAAPRRCESLRPSAAQCCFGVSKAAPCRAAYLD
jgi:hypothetical protein